MSTDEKAFRTKYSHEKGMDYVFLSIDRELTGEECEELIVKCFGSFTVPIDQTARAPCAQPSCKVPFEESTRYVRSGIALTCCNLRDKLGRVYLPSPGQQRPWTRIHFHLVNNR